MELTKKQIIIGAASALLIGALVVRFSLPAKVQIKVQEKIVEKEVVKWKTKYVKNEQKNKDTVIIETRFPDGTVKKEKHIIDKGTIVVDKTNEGSKEKETEILEKDSTFYYKTYYREIFSVVEIYHFLSLTDKLIHTPYKIMLRYMEGNDGEPILYGRYGYRI